MNVKITYSVPFEKVPEKIDTLVREASIELQKASEELAPSSEILATLETIDNIRKKLAQVDFLLEDCYSILAGYNKTLAELRLPRKKDEQHDDTNAT
jgi:hypothetical protein